MSKKCNREMILGVLMTLAVTFSLQAADPENLSDWKFGEVQVGKPFSHEELKGKVVVLEYWGVW